METPEAQAAPWSRTIAIGCFMAPIGFFSGGMIAAFASKLLAYVTRAKACEGVPACNWLEFTVVGGAIGMITLPAFVMWALRSPKRPNT
ncbi:MAG: hypothetical protein AABZ29_07150 [Gemmatimonadota bacterium]